MAQGRNRIRKRKSWSENEKRDQSCRRRMTDPAIWPDCCRVQERYLWTMPITGCKIVKPERGCRYASIKAQLSFRTTIKGQFHFPTHRCQEELATACRS